MLLGHPTQRDLNWEEKRRKALERRHAPKVIPITGKQLASIVGRGKESSSSPFQYNNKEYKSRTPSTTAATTSFSEENRGDAFNAPPTDDHHDQKVMMMPGGGGGGVAPPPLGKDPEFEKMVQEEMRKLEAEFEQHLAIDSSPVKLGGGGLDSESSAHMMMPLSSSSVGHGNNDDDDHHAAGGGDHSHEAEVELPSSPVPHHDPYPHHHPSSYSAAPTSLSPSAEAAAAATAPSSSSLSGQTPRSHGFGRGILTLYGSTPSHELQKSLPAAFSLSSGATKQQRSALTGFGRGIHTLYESPEHNQHKREQQLEYAKALKEQLYDGGGGHDGRDRMARATFSEGVYTGLPIGAIGGRNRSSPPHRQYPGLEHMFDDPEACRHRHMDQVQYHQALDEQVLQKRKQQEKEGLSFNSPVVGRLSPYRHTYESGSSGGAITNAAISPSRALPTSIYVSEMEVRQKTSQKKAAYAAALKQQIMDNEERRRQEKDALRRRERQEAELLNQEQQLMTRSAMISPSQAQHPSSTFSPFEGSAASQGNLHTTPGGGGLLQSSSAFSSTNSSNMTEARRRLVRDVYGSNTSPWGPGRRLSPSPPRIPYPRDVNQPSPQRMTSGESPSMMSSFSSSQANNGQWTSPLPADMIMISPSSSSGLKPSFARHGALAYDPYLQETLGQRQQQALEQRFALEQQMEEKRRAKKEKEDQRKAEEEMEMRKMAEEYHRAKEEEEAERRRRDAADNEAKEAALAEAQRRKDAAEKAARARYEEDEAEKRNLHNARGRHHQTRGGAGMEEDDSLWDASAASPSGGARRPHPSSSAFNRQRGESSLTTDSKFIAVDDGDLRPSGGVGRYSGQARKPYLQASGAAVGLSSPTSYRSKTGAAAGGGGDDEMDSFVDNWQRSRGAVGGGGDSRLFGDSLASESTLMFLNEEEKQSAEKEYWQQRGGYKGRGEGGPTASSAHPHQVGAMSPLTELLENHHEIQPDREALAEIHAAGGGEGETGKGDGNGLVDLDGSLDLGSLEGVLDGAGDGLNQYEGEGEGARGGDYTDESFEAEGRVSAMLRDINRELGEEVVVDDGTGALIAQEGEGEEASAGVENDSAADPPNSGRRKWQMPESNEDKERVINDISNPTG